RLGAFNRMIVGAVDHAEPHRLHVAWGFLCSDESPHRAGVIQEVRGVRLEVADRKIRIPHDLDRALESGFVELRNGTHDHEIPDARQRKGFGDLHVHVFWTVESDALTAAAILSRAASPLSGDRGTRER